MVLTPQHFINPHSFAIQQLFSIQISTNIVTLRQIYKDGPIYNAGLDIQRG